MKALLISHERILQADNRSHRCRYSLSSSQHVCHRESCVSSQFHCLCRFCTDHSAAPAHRQKGVCSYACLIINFTPRPSLNQGVKRIAQLYCTASASKFKYERVSEWTPINIGNRQRCCLCKTQVVTYQQYTRIWRSNRPRGEGQWKVSGFDDQRQLADYVWLLIIRALRLRGFCRHTRRPRVRCAVSSHCISLCSPTV